MYRIIGVFADDSGEYHVKLIKKESLNTAYSWNSVDGDIDWDDSTLYAGLNGSYFLTNTTYSYMQDSTWYDLIEIWDYIAVNTLTYSSYLSTGDYGINYPYNTNEIVFYHETNQTSLISDTCYYRQGSGGLGTVVANCTSGTYKNVSARIGLMYVSDYLLGSGVSLDDYSYQDSCTLYTSSWLYMVNNDSNSLSTSQQDPPASAEWLITRFGIYNDNNAYHAYNVYSSGCIGGGNSIDITEEYSTRPTFYLSSSVQCSSGTGTADDPIILSVN